MARKARLGIVTRLAIRMIIAVLVTGVIAAVISLQLPNSYRARSLLILAPMPFEQKDEVPGLVATQADPMRRISYVEVEMLEKLPMPDYRILFTSEEIAAQVRDRLLQEYAEAGIEAGTLTIEKVQRAMEVRSRVHIQTLDEVQYQQVVELLLTTASPAIAADVTNYWTELCIELAERMRTASREGAVEFLRKRIREENEDLERALQQLEDIEREWFPDGMTDRLNRLESAVAELRVRKSSLRIEAARIEGELREFPADDGSVKRMTLKSSLAGLRAEEQILEEETAALEKEIQPLRTDRARISRQAAALELDISAARRYLEELNVTLRAMQLSAADDVPEFKIAGLAVPPEEKTAPHRSLIVLVAMFLAAVAVPVHLFGVIALEKYARDLEKEAAADQGA
jgi:uncharacterized protein involved in exopolysaccharide biosynthesis